MSLSLNMKLTDYRLDSRVVLELQPPHAEQQVGARSGVVAPSRLLDEGEHRRRAAAAGRQGHAEQVPHLGHDGEHLFHGRSPPEPLPFTRSDSTTGREDSHPPTLPSQTSLLSLGSGALGGSDFLFTHLWGRDILGTSPKRRSEKVA